MDVRIFDKIIEALAPYAYQLLLAVLEGIERGLEEAIKSKSG